MQNHPSNPGQPDTFICHASEDKEAIARPLHEALTKLGIHSWLDESEIRLGQSIRQKIDEGLANCRSATVILSRPFFSKNWPQYEMDGIIGRHMQGELLLFPIRHGITIDEIRGHSPSLAGLGLWSTSDYCPVQIAVEISEQLGTSRETPVDTPEVPNRAANVESEGSAGARTFGTFYIAPAGTPELPPNTEPEVDSPLLFSNPTRLRGWIPVVGSNEELEYIVEETTLRVRLSWGNSWGGTEYLAAQTLSGDQPFALTIRRSDGIQAYLSSVLNRSPTNILLESSNRSGWMTFRIR